MLIQSLFILLILILNVQIFQSNRIYGAWIIIHKFFANCNLFKFTPTNQLNITIAAIIGHYIAEAIYIFKKPIQYPDLIIIASLVHS